MGAIEPQARFFSRDRGLALLVRKGNPSVRRPPYLLMTRSGRSPTRAR
jgi:hypothetical protein